jgi:hypothetical protein
MGYFKNNRFRGAALALFAAAAASLLIYGIASAATNISGAANERFAWNDVIGWIDFYGTDTVTVSSYKLAGYASSSAGDISLDCATTRAGNICGTSNYSVINDGLGNLSGWAWNDVYGWISFCGGQGTSDCPGNTAYRVLINPNTGVFTNYAWNDVVGWISFNCSDPGVCGTSDYKVKTSWIATSTSGTVISVVYDTGIAAGAQLNSFLWHGSQPVGTRVDFQFASSNATSGPWTFIGPDGTSNSYYTVSPGTSRALGYGLHTDKRYFRYKAVLFSDQAQRLSPRIDEVVVNWSP